MNESESLKQALCDYLEGVLGQSVIDREANQGEISILMSRVEHALHDSDQERVIALLPEIAESAILIGKARGRFELVSEIISVMSKWEKSQ